MLARRLLEAGHSVHVGSRSEAWGAEAAATVGARALTLDATDQVPITRAFTRVRDEAGSLEVLVNNASIAGQQQPPACSRQATPRRGQHLLRLRRRGAWLGAVVDAGLLDPPAQGVVRGPPLRAGGVGAGRG